jgi:trigger factor
VTATFPTNYLSQTLAGKTAVFAVTAKSIEAPGPALTGDELAKVVGLESVHKLHDAVKERLQREHAVATRARVKRGLLDKLDQLHPFTPPPTLVDEEFNGVWNTVMNDLKSSNRTFADEDTTEEKAREDYRKIADRRVRLGLVLAEIGEKNNIRVTDEEMTRAIVERARQFPGREQEAWDHFRNNPSSVAALRAPIFEEKVVDFILELAKVTEKSVSREELFKEDEETAPA